MPLCPEYLRTIAARTLAHQEQHAPSYREGTRDHDVSQNIAALLQHMTGPPPFDLLDFDCGPRCGLHTIKALGHRIVGPDGAPRAQGGCEVLEQSILQLELPSQRYDGVFADAVLFHVPRYRHRCCDNCRPADSQAACCSVPTPRGDGHEGWNGERYSAFLASPTWRALVTAAAFDELDHFYRPPGLPIEHQPWLARVRRKS